MTIAVTDYKNGGYFTGGGNTETATFKLLGGKYGIVANATWGGGNLAFQTLCPDGTTYVAAATAFTADGTTTVDCPPGTYRFLITTSSAVQASLTPIPYRPAA